MGACQFLRCLLCIICQDGDMAHFAVMLCLSLAIVMDMPLRIVRSDPLDRPYMLPKHVYHNCRAEEFRLLQ